MKELTQRERIFAGIGLLCGLGIGILGSYLVTTLPHQTNAASPVIPPQPQTKMYLSTDWSFNQSIQEVVLHVPVIYLVVEGRNLCKSDLSNTPCSTEANATIPLSIQQSLVQGVCTELACHLTNVLPIPNSNGELSFEIRIGVALATGSEIALGAWHVQLPSQPCAGKLTITTNIFIPEICVTQK